MKIVPENKVPSKEQIDNLIAIALDEDIGLGDITTRSIVCLLYTSPSPRD